MSEIRMFAGNFAPKTWAFCSGQLLAINTNQALFALLGTTYGGNGIQTFGLPDFRGRMAIGTGQGPGLPNVQLGEIEGVNSVTLLSPNMPMHTHVAAPNSTISVPAYGDTGSTGSPDGNVLASLAGLYSTKTPDTNMKGITSALTIAAAGGSQPMNIEQPYLGMNYIICLQGIFPSRN